MVFFNLWSLNNVYSTQNMDRIRDGLKVELTHAPDLKAKIEISITFLEPKIERQGAPGLIEIHALCSKVNPKMDRIDKDVLTDR